MNLRNSFIHLHPAAKLLIVFTLAFLGVFISQIFNLIFITFSMPEKLEGFVEITDNISIGAIKILQIINSILIFLLPAYIIAYISTPDPASFLKINTPRRKKDFLLAALITLSSFAIINFLAKINSGLQLPESMSNLENLIREMEETTEQIQLRMLNVSGIGGLLFNLLVIAVFPAITEELFFRGIVQRLFKDWTQNPHVAIILAGFIFSFAHFQFYGFVPRMFMGITLGYLLFLTNNLWVPIFAHFLNNGIVVVLYYVRHKSDNTFQPDEWGNSINSPYLYISLVLFVVVGFYFFQRKRKLSL